MPSQGSSAPRCKICKISNGRKKGRECLGLRSCKDLSLPAYLSSHASSRMLMQSVLPNLIEQKCNERFDAAVDVWTQAGNLPPPESGFPNQKEWDNVNCTALVGFLKQGLDQHHLACHNSALSPHSGDWLNSLPCSSLGTLLDNESLRIGVAFRLGLRICTPHKCRCGSVVDEFGLHPLSCHLSAGRFPRHSALNDIIKRSLETAGFPSQLEPVGLDRGDGKRPDGITLFPFKSGKSLIWDATCSCTFCPSNIVSSTISPGSAAASAETSKITKYSSLTDRYIFTPFAVETSGVIGPLSLDFIKDIGRKAAQERREPRESEWLLQRISLAVVRGNAHSILSAGISKLSLD